MYQNLSLTYGMSGWSIMQHHFTADNIVCSTKILVHVSLTSRECPQEMAGLRIEIIKLRVLVLRVQAVGTIGDLTLYLS